MRILRLYVCTPSLFSTKALTKSVGSSFSIHRSYRATLKLNNKKKENLNQPTHVRGFWGTKIEYVQTEDTSDKQKLKSNESTVEVEHQH